MSEPGAVTVARDAGRDGRAAAGTARRVRRVRGLPGGRAVVGAFLVAAAAVGVFAAYLDATAAPRTSFLVARTSVDPGTRIPDAQTLAELFELRPIALEGQIAERAVAGEAVEEVVGQLVVSPLAPGDLVLRSGLVPDDSVWGAEQLSFAIDPAMAVDGRLRPGEHIDVLATYGTGASSWTAYVVRDVPLVRIAGGEGGGLGASPLVITVALPSAVDVQALAHAVHTADVVVSRSAATRAEDEATPDAYQPVFDPPNARADGPGAGLDQGPTADLDDGPGVGADDDGAGLRQRGGTG